MISAGFRNTATVVAVLTIMVVLLRSLQVSAVALVGSANVDEDLQHSIRNQSTDVKRQRFLRGERKAAVITERLPDMKVRLFFVINHHHHHHHFILLIKIQINF